MKKKTLYKKNFGVDQPAYLCSVLSAFADRCLDSNWALSRENLSSGCPTKQVSNQSPQLQRLARKLKFHL